MVETLGGLDNFNDVDNGLDSTVNNPGRRSFLGRAACALVTLTGGAVIKILVDEYSDQYNPPVKIFLNQELSNIEQKYDVTIEGVEQLKPEQLAVIGAFLTSIHSRSLVLNKDPYYSGLKIKINNNTSKESSGYSLNFSPKDLNQNNFINGLSLFTTELIYKDLIFGRINNWGNALIELLGTKTQDVINSLDTEISKTTNLYTSKKFTNLRNLLIINNTDSRARFISILAGDYISDIGRITNLKDPSIFRNSYGFLDLILGKHALYNFMRNDILRKNEYGINAIVGN